MFPIPNKTILLIGLFLAGFATGWQVHGWKTKSDQAHSIAKTEKVAQNATGEADKVVVSAQKQQAESKTVYRTIKEKINDKNDHRVCFADAESLQLWNSAIAGADSHRPEPAGETSQADTTQNLAASVEQVLSNATDNFQICNENAIKHNALIDAVEVYKGKMCVCSQ